MKAQLGLDRALSFINCHLQPAETGQIATREGLLRRAVTISRQAGSGAHHIAERLTALLQAHTPAEAAPWTVFDRNLVDKVCQEHELPEHMSRFMREDRTSAISDTMEELFGLHPPSSELVHKVTETVVHLAELGNVILIGRGAAVATGSLEHVVHIRLVSSLERRIDRVRDWNKIDRQAALELIQKEDGGRERYLKRYFKADINDPLLYHATINTDKISYDETARMIADLVLKRV